MSWAKAHGLIQTLVIKEIVALENKAKWHEQEHEEEDYSHTEAAKIYRREAEVLREALFVLARGV
tara:strand:- start:3872 stop:4066 length:195 start_codon:yes stop_codon:yes gene_type:complete